MDTNTLHTRIKNRFLEMSHVELAPNSVLDNFIYASAEGLNSCYNEILANKTPHIYTQLKGDNLDDLGYLVNCPRYENESDASYLTRLMSWSTNNEACNITAIRNALSNLTYSSHATYVPFVQGTATAAVFLIPKNYDDITIDRAILEATERLSLVVAPDDYIIYQIPNVLSIDISVYIHVEKDYDMRAIKNDIVERIKNYVNDIAIGEHLSYGAINAIGIQTKGVKFFNTNAIFINNTLLNSLSRIQTIKDKFLFNEISWNEVDN